MAHTATTKSVVDSFGIDADDLDALVAFDVPERLQAMIFKSIIELDSRDEDVLSATSYLTGRLEATARAVERGDHASGGWAQDAEKLTVAVARRTDAINTLKSMLFAAGLRP